MNTNSLAVWFNQHQRDFPWRRSPSAYAVWVSEVMLQQTQASVVIPYFIRWMEEFPTLESLAKADLARVLKLWEGLGYYSRAKRLHEGAKVIFKDYGNTLPSTEKELRAIPGIGPYTVGAILSFAFKQKKPAVDGNVIRVVSRLYALEGDVEKASTKRRIYQLVDKALEAEKPYVIMEALIELGATVCKKQPTCHQCPLKLDCKAFEDQRAHEFPVSSKKIQIEKKLHYVHLCICNHRLLVKKPAQDHRLMGHLHQIPFIDSVSEESGAEYLKDMQFLYSSQEHFTQSFTKYKVLLEANVYQASGPIAIEGYEWLEKQDLLRCTFSSGDRKILQWALTQALL